MTLRALRVGDSVSTGHGPGLVVSVDMDRPRPYGVMLIRGSIMHLPPSQVIRLVPAGGPDDPPPPVGRRHYTGLIDRRLESVVMPVSLTPGMIEAAKDIDSRTFGDLAQHYQAIYTGLLSGLPDPDRH